MILLTARIIVRDFHRIRPSVRALVQTGKDYADVAVALLCACKPDSKKVSLLRLKQVCRMAGTERSIRDESLDSIKTRVVVKPSILCQIIKFDDFSFHVFPLKLSP